MPRDVMGQGGGGRQGLKVQAMEGNSAKPTPKPAPAPKPVLTEEKPPVKSKEEIASENATAAQLKAIEDAKKNYLEGFGKAESYLSDYQKIGGQAFGQMANDLMSGKYKTLPDGFNVGQQPEAYKFQQFQFDPNQDPGAKFTMQQGANAINTNAAAQGGGLSGSTLKALAQYGQDLGSQQYQNAFNQNMQTQQMQAQMAQQGIQNWQQQQGVAIGQNQQQLQNMGSLANVGLGAAQQNANLQMQQGQAIGDLSLQAGNVQAAGFMAPIDIDFQKQQLAFQQQQAQMQQAALNSQKKSKTGSVIGSIAGGLLGFAVGGPAGAMAGAGIGSGVGSLFS